MMPNRLQPPRLFQRIFGAMRTTGGGEGFGQGLPFGGVEPAGVALWEEQAQASRGRRAGR
jgi:hypothetical protein